MKIFMKNTLSILVIGCLLNGCSTQSIHDTEKLVDGQDAAAKAAAAKGVASVKQATAQSNQAFEINQGVWLGGHVIKVKKMEELPAVLKKSVTINDRFMTLTDLSDRIQADIDIPVRLSPEVSPYPASAMKGTAGSMQGGMSGPSGIGGAMPGGMGVSGGMGMPGAGGMMGGAGMMQPVHIDYGGSVSGLLDIVAARFGTHWKYTDGTILFYNLETKTFVLDTIPGDSALAANVTGGGAGAAGSGAGATPGAAPGGMPSPGGMAGGIPGGMSGGMGGGAAPITASGDMSGSSTSITSTLSVWSDIKNAVTSMLSPSGKAVITPSTGTVMVTDDPVYVARIEQYIDQENETLSRQVLVQVRVLSVSINDSDQYGINWNAVFNSLSKNIGVTATNAFPAGPGVGALAMNVLSTAGAGSPNANIRQFAGSSAVINALSTQGKVSLITSATVITLNNQPVPIQVGTQTSYLASTSNTVTANVGTTSSLIPGVVQSGFNMNLLPHLLSNQRVMLQFSVNISTLANMNTISSGGNTIQIPEVDSRDFLQRVSMRSGETLLLSGFEQTAGNLNKQGIGSANNVALGGGVSASRTRDIVVIMITPVVAPQEKSSLSSL